jgi:hypothetical protein
MVYFTSAATIRQLLEVFLKDIKVQKREGKEGKGKGIKTQMELFLVEFNWAFFTNL